LLNREPDRQVRRALLTALSQLGDSELPALAPGLLAKDPASVPLEVVRGLPVEEPGVERALIHLLDSRAPEYRQLASSMLRHSPGVDLGLIIQGLASPRRGVREGLYEVMASLKISDREIVDFARAELEVAYRHLQEAMAVDGLEAAPERELMATHLRQKKDARVMNVLRVLSSQDASGQMRIVLRGLASRDERLRSNALEALEDQVGRALADVMVPLLERQQERDTLAAGKKVFDLPDELGSPERLLAGLLGQEQWTTRYLALCLAARRGGVELEAGTWQSLLDSTNRHVWLLAGLLATAGERGVKLEEEVVAEAMSLTEKIVLLRGMEIFKGLTITELSAVATLCDRADYKPEETIIAEGEVGETMFLIVKGKVAVKKRAEDGCDVDLAEMGEGEYFGEMALFDDEERSASVFAAEPTECMVLHKQEFSEAVREYPQVALQMCSELSRRLRELHTKIKSMPVCF